MTIIQIRRDTTVNWVIVNPILAEGEFGKEIDTGRIKNGDGVTAWNDLPYYNSDVDLSNYATKDDVATAITNAITNTLNTEV